MSPIVIGCGVVSIVFSVAALLLLKALDAQKKFAGRVAAVRRSAGAVDPDSGVTATGPMRLVSMLGSLILSSGILSEKTISDLKETLAVAGLAGERGLGVFIGAKLILFLCFPVVMWFACRGIGVSAWLQDIATLLGAVIGLLAPDFIVKKIRSKYIKALDGGLPDALDMMVICSEAGMGLEPSISRVAAEIAYAHPVVALELQQTASELRVISDRRQALRNMGTRTGLEGLKRLGATLIQTTKYGTPLSQALRTLSAEMRAEMLTKFEERAAKLPVLLTVPMIVFILPTVFVVVGGPAMIQVMATAHQ